MFEGVTSQQLDAPSQQPQQGMYDPYALPMDPYIQQRPPSTWNLQMMLAVLDSKVKTGADFEDYYPMLILLIDNVGRIPNAEKTDINRLNRDIADILELSECMGTKKIVLSKMTALLFKMRSYVSYGGAPLNGLTGVSAIITQRSQAETQVKIPQQPERKKIFGVL